MFKFKCMECGKKFRTVKAAEKASLNGCPRCNGVDIDIDVEVNVDGNKPHVVPQDNVTGFNNRHED